MIVNTSSPLRGELSIPGDKSISHRALMFGAISEGPSEITNFLQGADCLSTISCFSKMGIEIQNLGDSVLLEGKGLHGLTPPESILYTGNSGTTTRLIAGILSGQSFTSCLDGDSSIRRRPMDRILQPLSQMGAQIRSKNNNSCAPLIIEGRPLTGIHYQSPVASAQVKSSILLAGLYADGPTYVTEPLLSRNHTELLLAQFGAKISVNGTTAGIEPDPRLKGQKIHVPGDISSAAFFAAAGLLVPGSRLLIKNVGINPTRAGFLKICEAMGASIQLINKQSYDMGEPVADLLVTSSSLHGTSIEGSIIPSLIDEIPILAVMAAFAEGRTVIKDAEELKIKESNRIRVMVEELSKMGAAIQETNDGMVIEGGKALHGAQIESHLDHRIAMAFAVAGLLADGPTEIMNDACVSISYPGFWKELERLQG